MSPREVHTDGPVAEHAEALARLRAGWSAVWMGHDGGWCVMDPTDLPWRAHRVIHTRTRCFVTADVPGHGLVTACTPADT